MNSPLLTFHLAANSHLDPVWLWDAQEGLNEAISTIRTMLTLMEERPELTYIRGESLIYEQILKHDPKSFKRIQELVQEGRWDVVGGTYLQPDLNLPATATLHKHFELGQRFFQEHFSRRPSVGWSADCFGHTAFLPDILQAHGLRAYAYGRPARGDEPKLFWWESPNGQRVLASNYVTGWYGCERDEIPRRLDAYLAAAVAEPVSHLLIPFGLGNHGGGPTRRHLNDIVSWAEAHPDVRVEYSGLHRYFAAVKAELEDQNIDLPVIHGELNFCLRGVYASALRIKTSYRKAEAAVQRLEAFSNAQPEASRLPVATLEDLWKRVLFNSFHDILPGTSIERALEEQLQQLGGIQSQVRELERTALLGVAEQMHVEVPSPPGDRPCAVPFLVFNPHLHAYRGPLEMEASLDYRPLHEYAGRPDEVPVEVRDPAGNRVPFQLIPTEHQFMPQLPWRCRVLIEAQIAAQGGGIYSIGLGEGEIENAPNLEVHTHSEPFSISSNLLSVCAAPGSVGVRINAAGRPLLSGDGLSVATFADGFGAWGGLYDEPEANVFDQLVATWTIAQSAVLEHGPLRSSLWVRFESGKSRVDFTFRVCKDRPAVDWEARLFFDEPGTRIKLRLPGGDLADFDVPGGVLRRGPSGEVPGGCWVLIHDSEGQACFGFASDCLYNFSAGDGVFAATLVRSSRYTLEMRDTPEIVSPHQPVIDNGEFRIRGLISLPSADLPKLALELEQPPLIMPVPPSRA